MCAYLKMPISKDFVPAPQARQPIIMRCRFMYIIRASRKIYKM